MSLLAGLAALSGFLVLSQTMARHRARVLAPVRPPVIRWLRVAGFALLSAAFGLSVAAWGWRFGPVAWFGLLTLLALPVAALWSVAERRRKQRGRR